MTEPTKRTDDPKDFDPRAFRHREPEGNGLSIGYGEAKLAVKGASVVMVLCVLAIIGSNFYVGYRLEQAFGAAYTHSSVEHSGLATAQDRTSCLLSMSPDDRMKFRDNYRAGDFVRWCPWMQK